MINISNKHGWELTENGVIDGYFAYDLDENEIKKYLNTWVGYNEISNKSGVLICNKMFTLKKADDETAYSLCGKFYNPISLCVLCPTGAKFNKDIEGNLLYDMKAQIHSIDDASFKIWWNEIKYDDLIEIRLELAKKIVGWDLINGEEFLKECIKLGADEKSIDYN